MSKTDILINKIKNSNLSDTDKEEIIKELEEGNLDKFLKLFLKVLKVGEVLSDFW